MSFNELNSVEHFIIHHLTGVNLNIVQCSIATIGTAKEKQNLLLCEILNEY